MTTHRPPPPDDPLRPSDPYPRPPAPPSSPAINAEVEADQRRIASSPAELRAFVETYEPLHASWLRAPTPETAATRQRYEAILRTGASPGAVLAALYLVDMWVGHPGIALPDGLPMEAAIVARALGFADDHPMELREVYHGVRGDVTRAWGPAPWTVLRPLKTHPWLENEIPFWGPTSSPVRVAPPSPEVLRVLPEIQAHLEAMFTGIQHAYTSREKIMAIGRRRYGAQPANFGGDEILHGPTLFRIGNMLERCWGEGEHHLATIARYRGDTKAGHLTAKAQNLLLIRTAAAEVARRINHNLRPRRGDQRVGRFRVEGQGSDRTRVKVKDPDRARGLFRVEVRERTTLILLMLYGVSFTKTEFERLIRQRPIPEERPENS
jgi:hypothetical protein